MTVTDDLIAFGQTTPPNDATAMMRLSLFDWAACGIAGADDRAFQTWAQSGQGGVPLFGGGSADRAQAALINGTLSHALDYDDTHFGHIGHPSVAVLPAVLAVAGGASMEAVIEAAAIGVEASILTGIWLGRAHYQVGFHQTATAGAFGATLGAARMLALSPDQTRHALGLCASMASGIKAQFGTMAKPLNAGLAARTGVEAALWAQNGMTAAPDGLAGPLGFGATHHGAAEPVQMDHDPWHITTISHKFHACCHGLHAMLEAIDDTRLTVDAVAEIHIHTHPRWMSVCNIAAPQTGLAAKFSYAHTAAMRLLGHDTGRIENYSDARAHDADLLELRGKVVVREDTRLSETQAEVQITLTNGQTLRLRHDLLAAMPLEVRAQKLRAKGAALVGQPHAEKLWSAAKGQSLAAFTDQFVRS